MNRFGGTEPAVHVAIVGSGPSGFYAAEALLEAGLPVQIDMFEKLPVPFGLVRYGVAPDHQKLKAVVEVFEQIASDPRFAFHGDVEIGNAVSLDDLRANYHAVILAYGSSRDRRLDVPGEDLPGVHSAASFVSWYNGHPDFQHMSFDLTQESVVVVGAGNVALDVCRILAKTVDELCKGDITEPALDALAASRVREITIVARRGPAQARFTTKELREFGSLEGCAPWVDGQDLELGEACRRELESLSHVVANRNLKLLRQFADAPERNRRCRFRFFLDPREAQGNGRLERVVFERMRLEGEAFAQRTAPTGETVAIEAGLMFRSVGYRGTPLKGLPFDEAQGVVPNRGGRVIDDGGRPRARLYATGWIKRGPSGVIGSNRACALETVQALVADLDMTIEAKPGRAGLDGSILGRGAITMDGWRRIDAAERRLGAPLGKPREKLTTRDAMRAAAHCAPSSEAASVESAQER